MANIQYRVSEGNPSSDQPFLDSHWTHYVAMASVIALVIVFGVLVTITAIGVARIETAHPPAGHSSRLRAYACRWLSSGLPGADPAVVLIHGASGNMEDMRLALGEKLARSHCVILIDRPGHGWSSRPPGDA